MTEEIPNVPVSEWPIENVIACRDALRAMQDLSREMLREMVKHGAKFTEAEIEEMSKIEDLDELNNVYDSSL